MKRPLWLVAGLVAAIVVVVLFAPGVQESIEAYVLSWLARLAG